MPTGWGVKPCTGAPSASHQDLDRWSSVQANFLLLWLCLLSALISNAVMKSEAIGGKGKVCFFLFFALVLLLATGRRLKGHLVSFSAAKRGLISPFFSLFCSHCAWHFAGFYWTFIQTKTALHDLFKQHHGQLDMVGEGWHSLLSVYFSMLEKYCMLIIQPVISRSEPEEQNSHQRPRPLVCSADASTPGVCL